MTWADVYEYNKPSILRLVCGARSGTGWIAAHSMRLGKYFIMTANHNIKSFGNKVDQIEIVSDHHDITFL